MTKASDNVFPKIIGAEGAAPGTPAAATAIAYVKADGLWYSKDDAGVETLMSSGAASGIPATILDAKGDIIAATAADTAAKLTVGANDTVLTADSSTATGLKWAAAGGGGATINYGSLKPGTPTYDFDAALSGWTAVSNTGAFATGNCFAQALDGSHLSLGYQAQSGFLYNTVANTDLTVTCGGLFSSLGDAQDFMMGIAVLNTANTGVGLVAYNDGNAYLANITGGLYTGILQTITGYGHSAAGVQPSSRTPYAMRINRVGNDWTGQLSMDGNNWLTATASSTVAITAARVGLGLFFNNAAAYKGRVFCDWLNVA